MKERLIGKILGGLVGGIILSGIWLLIFFYLTRNVQYYGLAILPAIFISIVLFIVGCVIGVIIGGKVR